MSIKINIGDKAYDESNDRMITITGRHFSDYSVIASEIVTDFDDDGDEIGTHEHSESLILTQAEINRYFGHNQHVWLDD